jgi:hypothetical protein
MFRVARAPAGCQLEDLQPLHIAGATPGTDFIDAAKTTDTDVIIVEGAFADAG